MKKTIIFVLIGVAVLISGAFVYLKVILPDVDDAPEITLDKSSAAIERGKYLANHVSVCVDCHSTRDWSKFSAPIVPGTFGKGGERFDQTMGFPGAYYSANITPAGIANWTDGEVFRAITTGVSKNGKALFPVMPYHLYGQMDEDDIKAIVAYIRTFHPIKNQIPKGKSDFPMNLLINTMPHNPSFTKIPSRKNAVLYGKYLFTAAACSECHTPTEKGKPVAGKFLAGGSEFKLPGGTLRSANITPDKESGIGNWSEEAFINRFKYYEKNKFTMPVVGKDDFQTIMPWTMYGGMTEEDLGAIYAYLQSVEPVKNKVEHFTKF